MARHPLGFFAMLCLAAASASAQPPADEREQPPPDEAPAEQAPVTQEQIQETLEQVGAAGDFAEDVKAATVERLTEALERLAEAEEAGARAAGFRAEAAKAPERLETIRQELAQPAPPPDVSPPPDATLAQLEQGLQQAEAELKAAREAEEELRNESDRRAQRREEIAAVLAESRQALAEVEASLPVAAPSDEPALVTESRRLLLQARRKALRARIDALEAEAASYDARRDLLPARRDLALRRVTRAEQTVQAWRPLVETRRAREAKAAAKEAERLSREAARRHPVLQEFASENAALAERLAGPQGLSARISEVGQRATSLRQELQSLRSDFESVRRRIAYSGLNRATGLILRRQFETLPDPASLRDALERTQRRLEDAEYDFIELEERRVGAGDIDRVTQELLQQINGAPTQATRPGLEAAARELVAARRDLLDQLIASITTYVDRLAKLDETLRAMLGATNEYRSFIEERILWVRSVARGRTPTIGDMVETARWALDPQAWRRAMSQVGARARDSWPAHSAPLLTIAALYALRPRIRRRLRDLAGQTSNPLTDSVGVTFAALGLTILAALPLPLLLWWLGWTLTSPPGQPAPVMAAGTGLQWAAALLFPLDLLRHLMRRTGVGLAHFRWPACAAGALRRDLRWLIPVMIAAELIVVGLDRHGEEAASATVGRIAFTISMLALAAFIQRTLRPSGPVLSEALAKNSGGWLDRLKYLWYPALVGLPLLLIALAWSGYYYTALRLEDRLEWTLLLLLALVIVQSLLLRWLFVARRKVAIRDARQRHEQAGAEPATKDAAGMPTERAGWSLGAPSVDLPAVSTQSRQLIRTTVVLAVVVGLYLIWSSVLPALRALDRVQLWPEVRLVSGGAARPLRAVETPAAPNQDAPPADAAPPAPAVGGPTPMLPGAGGLRPAPPQPVEEAEAPLTVTLADVGLALFVLLATWAAFRNLPGLVEIAVLQRLPLDAGSRYALSTVLRYLIAIVGIALAFAMVGITWQKVQWLAAALTFGLAFGLQEIFANFVSGLIILAERPFRVGDTVTVGGVSGTVTRIQMRATTVLDWDRKELVIPNKSFITGEVVNWTLSAPLLRLTIPVGVSYSSDVDQVETLLREMAGAHPHVLKDPAPQILFLGFGDSALNFDLRVFIPHIDYLLSIKHDMHNAIIKRFREAGVEIAFPQRDLHIRSAEALQEIVRGGRAEAATFASDPS